MKYFIILISSFLFGFLPHEAVAQPPNPPVGWEFVRSLDSLTIFDFHASGDTIFIQGNDAHEAINRHFQIVSVNGGKDWDSVSLPRPIFHWDTYPNEARLCLINYVKNQLVFYTGTDGKHFDSVIIGADTTGELGQFDKFFIDPFDRAHWLYIGTSGVGPSLASLLSQSFDGGHNWQPVSVPIIPAQQLNMELVFDARRAGVWYVHILATRFPQNDTSFVVRTTNNGQTFQRVKQWGTQYGIGKAGEVRRWWGYDNPKDSWGLSRQILYGPLIGNENDDSLKAYNWLSIFHPLLPLAEPSAGYIRRLWRYAGEFGFYYPNTYIVSQANPLVAIIAENEVRWDTTTGKSKYVTSWIHQTEDNWHTWSTVWESGPFESVDRTFLDEKPLTLWALTKFLTDTALNDYHPDRYTSYLYKHSIKLAVPQSQNFAPLTLVAYPSPTNGVVRVKLVDGSARIRSIEVYDVTGKVVLTTSNDFYFSQGTLEWSIPENIPSGLYFLKIKTDNSTYHVKVLLQR